ncbi:MAG: serine protease, partial [Treponema sp.]|nr:serine protease [Treponema sp.]
MGNRKIYLSLLLIVLIFGCITVSCKTTPVSTVFEDLTIESTGTGFFITNDGYVVTSAHVVEDAYVIGVWVNNNRFPAQLISMDRETDVAILKINYRPSNYFLLANIDAAKRADKIYVLGFPLTSILTSEIRITDGIISAFSGMAGDQRVFQITAPVQGGNSGGPIINERFEVLGIVDSKLNMAMLNVDNIAFGVKNSYIRSLLPQDVRNTGSNIRNMQDAEKATVQISVDDVFEGPPIIIVNNTGLNVTSVYISQTASDVWGMNRFGREQVLVNGESISLNLPFPITVVNRYDILLEDEDGNTHTQMDVRVTPNGRIVFETDRFLTGTYSYSDDLSISFIGNNFTRTSILGRDNGTYRLSGNNIIFSESMYGSNTWTVIDLNTIRDPEGDLWKKQDVVSSVLSGRYSFSEG